MKIRHVIGPAFAIAFANLAALGLLAGHVGASRAYVVGLHTLFRDHAGAVTVAGGLALVLTALAARRLKSSREVGLLFAFVFVADVVAGLGVVAAFGEITLDQLPRVIATETALGIQLLAVGAGGFIGYFGRPGSPSRLRPHA